MNKSLLTLVMSLFIGTAFGGGNLFFIDEKSYPCTKTIELKGKSSSNNLDVVIAKDGTKGLFVVSTPTMTGVLIRGKLIIYLDDGSVISCVDRGKYDYVDNIATNVYYLTTDELTKMKNSNLNTVRYTLKCSDCMMSTEEGDFSASNKSSGLYGSADKTDVPSLIKKLFN